MRLFVFSHITGSSRRHATTQARTPSLKGTFTHPCWTYWPFFLNLPTSLHPFYPFYFLRPASPHAHTSLISTHTASPRDEVDTLHPRNYCSHCVAQPQAICGACPKSLEGQAKFEECWTADRLVSWRGGRKWGGGKRGRHSPT